VQENVLVTCAVTYVKGEATKNIFRFVPVVNIRNPVGDGLLDPRIASLHA